MVKDSDRKSKPRIYNRREESPGYALVVAANLYHRNLRDHISDLGLTPAQLSILINLRRLTLGGKPVSQIELAKYAMMDKTMVSELLKTLESRGFIGRIKYSDDQRVKAFIPTDAGMELAEAAKERAEEADDEFFSVLGDDVDRFAAALIKLIQAHDHFL